MSDSFLLRKVEISRLYERKISCLTDNQKTIVDSWMKKALYHDEELKNSEQALRIARQMTNYLESIPDNSPGPDSPDSPDN